MKKSILIIFIIITIISSIAYFKLIKNQNKYQNKDLNILLSLEDKTTPNSLWCGTFNLIWNDLKNDIIKQDIIFANQPTIITNLNKETFTTKELNENSYYKIYGHPTLNLKNEITKNLKLKFNETSDILADFNWQDNNETDYFLYAMLKKEFKFLNEFTILPKDNFKDTPNIAYFGIDETTNENIYNQVQILYYHDANNFAVKLLTKENEEIILSRGINGNTMLKIYRDIIKNSQKYQENKNFTSNDTLKIPYLNLKIKKEFNELENQPFYSANNTKYYIEKALQTISLELNESGGKVKSEAGMAVNSFSATENNPRHFDFTSDFVLFLKEQNKSLPYFGALINDITKFN